MFSPKPTIQSYPKSGKYPAHKRWEDQFPFLVKYLSQIKMNIDNFHLKDLWKLKTEINELMATGRDAARLKKLKAEYDSKRDKLVAETQKDSFVAKLKDKLQNQEPSNLSLEELFIKIQCSIYLTCEMNYPALKKANNKLTELNTSLHKVVTLENFARVSQTNLVGVNAVYAEFETAIAAFTSMTLLMDSKSELTFTKDVCPTPASPKVHDDKCDLVKGLLSLYKQLDKFLQNHFSPIFLASNLYPWLCAQASATHQKLESLKVLIKDNPSLSSTAIFRPVPTEDTQLNDFQYLKQLENWAETCTLIIKRKIKFINLKKDLIAGVRNLFSDILLLYAKASQNSATFFREFVGTEFKKEQLAMIEIWIGNETRERNKKLLLALQALLTLYFTIKDSKHNLAFADSSFF